MALDRCTYKVGHNTDTCVHALGKWHMHANQLVDQTAEHLVFLAQQPNTHLIRKQVTYSSQCYNKLAKTHIKAQMQIIVARL